MPPMRRVLARGGRQLAAGLGWSWPGLGLAAVLMLAVLVPATGHDRAGPIRALAPVSEAADGFREPIGVAVDETGAIFVSDREADTVVRLSPGGHRQTLVRHLDDPAGLAFDRDGGLLIAEEGEDRVLHRSPSGALRVLVAGIRHPRWLAVADDGGLYISARGLRGDHRDHDDDEDGGEMILRLGPDGRLSLVADGFVGLEGIAVHAQTLYAAADRRHGESRGQASNLVRFPIRPDGSLGPMAVLVRGVIRKPAGLAVDALGGVFVAAARLRDDHDGDDRHHRSDDDDDDAGVILKWRPDGRLVTFATGLDDPQGLAFEAAGHLLAVEDPRILRFHAPDPPAVTVPAFTSQAVLPVHGTAQPGARVDLFLNDAATALSATAGPSGAFTIPVPLPPDTESELALVATAHGGDGLSSAFVQVRVTQDGLGPAVAFLSPPAGAFLRGSVTVQAQATDAASGVADVALRVDGQPLPAALAPAPPAPSVTATATLNTASLADGPRTLSAAAADRAGNGRTVTRDVVVDNTPPETEVTGGPAGDIGETTATITFAGADNLTPPASLVFAWRLDGGPFTAFSPATAATVTGLAAGPHTFEVKARDLAGNEDPTPAVRAFAVRSGPAITSVEPDSGAIGALIAIRGSGFAPGATQVTFAGTAAAIRTMSATEITTTVPPGATTGLLAVTTPQGTATRPFTVLATQDFEIGVVPADGQVLQGASATFTVDLTSLGGTPFTGLASLAAENLPPGISAAFDTPTLTGGQHGALTLSASDTAAVGPASFTVRATAPGEGAPLSHTATAQVTVVAGGRTAVVGQVTFVDGRPIQAVKLMLDTQIAFTDAGGNFQVLDPPAGTQTLGIDANAAQPGLPIYAVDVVLTAGQVTQLAPFRITPPPPPERFTLIDNAAADQVVTDARFPGLSLTLPRGVSIIGWDGTAKTRIALERLTPDRLPVPPPPGFTRSLYQVYFGTPMGGLPQAALPVTLPNDQDAPPGEQIEIWYYDAAPFAGVPAGWRLAGLGTVSEDGSRVVSDPGVGIARFCGVCGLFCLLRQQGGQPNRNPDGSEEGDPVNLALGQAIVDKTDLVLPGRLPVVVHRTFNPEDPFGGIAGFQLGLGPGWALSMDVVLQEETPTLRRLIWPGNARFAFVQQSGSTFVNTTHPRFAGAVLTEEGFASTRLRFKDGTTWRFGRVPLVFGVLMLVEQTDRNGNRLTIDRDFAGRPTQVREPGGRVVTLTVDPFIGRITEVRDPAGRTVRYRYGSTFPLRLEEVTDPAGGGTRYTYTPEGRLLTVTDPRSIPYLTHQYDTQGRIIRQTQADGGIWRFAYEGPPGAHTRVSVTDPRGTVTTHRLSNGGFASEVVDGLGQPSREERDAQGLLTATIDPLGRVTRFQYDAVGNVTRITDAAGQSRAFTYEPAFNRVSTITDGLGQVSRFEYDARGNVTARVDPGGHRTTLAYDAFGQPISSTDALGQTTRLEYDAVGNLTALIDPLGNASRREHDAASRVTRQVDPRGRATLLAYDALSRITAITDARGGVTRFTYDANGNLLTVTDPRGEVVTQSYDSMDRLATRTDAAGALERFEYDLLGNLTRHVDRRGLAASFSYDPLNRRVGAAYADGATAAYVYDAGGRLVRASDTVGGAILNGYDAVDRLVSQVTAAGTLAYQYDALGRRTRMEAPGQAPVTYGYDASSRLVQVAQGSQVVGLELDALGRRTRLTLPNGVTTEYAYDAASRMTGLAFAGPLGPLGDLTYQYDAAGNRRQVGGSLARTLLPAAVPGASHDAANRLLAFGDRSLTYDRNGNTLSLTDPAGVTTFAWDSRNRLTAVTGPGGTTTFAYDPFGRRISRQVDGQLTRYVYDGLDVTQQIDATGTTSYLRSLTVDEALSFTNRDGTYFSIYDPLGSTLAVTDGAAALVADYTYDPFGHTVASDPGFANPFQYTRREHDGAGLYHYRARYYVPELHRFLSEDPVGYAGRQVNLYAYVGNNPVNFTDSTGLLLDTLVDIASIGYDLYRLISDGRKGMGGNLTALGLDVAGALIPFATGLGPASRAARGAGTEVVQRAMSRAELEATQASGLMRGGREGTHHVSDAVNSDALRARQRLALPQTPEVRVTMEVPAGTFSPPTRVPGDFGMPGGGMQRTATGNVPVNIIRVDPY
jgi:RHS repeat-associated protein